MSVKELYFIGINLLVRKMYGANILNFIYSAKLAGGISVGQGVRIRSRSGSGSWGSRFGPFGGRSWSRRGIRRALRGRWP